MSIPLEVKPEGLFCTPGDFFIDAQRPVPLCVVTHAHGDHSRWGHQLYIATKESEPIMRRRLGAQINIQTYDYGEKFKLGDTWVSFHPAGHIFGSAQVRIEHKKTVTVISGDYKRENDPTCRPFEVVPCNTFVTESTFALPIYRWQPAQEVAKQIFDWWQENKNNGLATVIFAYALGKAQRLMALLAELTEQPIYLHGAVVPLATIYSERGVKLHYLPVSETEKGKKFAGELIIAPPSAAGTTWLKRFMPCKTALASGWMQVRGTRRRRATDRGFVLSDHADWNGLLQTIDETGAQNILTTHGNAHDLARYLVETRGLNAFELKGLEQITEEDVGE